MNNAANATRTSPNGYAVNVTRITTGLRFAAHGQVFEVVGEPITVGWNSVSVRVREIGGRFDGNEFAAFLDAR